MKQTVLEADRLYRKEAETEQDGRRLRSEARTLAAVAHPGVVMVRHAEVDGSGLVCRLDTALVTGTTFGELAPQPSQAIAAIGASLATTVADIHVLGVFHRRIDASHVLIDDQGLPVLCGFGDAGPAAGGEDADDLGRRDVAALAAMLEAALAGSDAQTLRSTLSNAFRAGRWRRSPDARSLARQLIRAVPDARLGPLGPPGALGPPDRLVPARSQPKEGRRRVTRRRAVRSLVAAGLAAILASTLAGALAGPIHGSPAHPTSTSYPCPAADEGCIPVPLGSGPITVSDSRYRIEAAGWPGVVVIGRWSCSGFGLPATLDLASGRVWVFGRWPASGAPAVATLVGTVPGASGLQVIPGASGCDRLAVTRRNATAVELPPFPGTRK